MTTTPFTNQLAHALRQHCGLMAGDYVAVLGEATTMRPVYTALWQLGVCAVPLDMGTLSNTQTLNASKAIYLIAQDNKLARAVRAVEPGIHDVLGAPECREVIQFGGEAGGTFTHLDSLAALASHEPIHPNTHWQDATAALQLFLFFMDRVNAYTYSLDEIREYALRRKAEPKPKMRPKFSALGFYPIADEFVLTLAS